MMFPAASVLANGKGVGASNGCPLITATAAQPGTSRTTPARLCAPLAA